MGTHFFRILAGRALEDPGYPALTMSEMFVIVASAKTPEPVRQELATALAAAITPSPVRAAMKAAYFDLLSLQPAQISARLRSESERWGSVVKATGYKSED